MARPMIGWKEWVHLPELDIGPIKAKTDTGARTSALHASDIQITDGIATFRVDTIQGRDDFFIEASAPLKEIRSVRDSGGKATMRPVIETTLRVCGQEVPIELTLIAREEMVFRMLLGRSAIRDRFLVDCGKEYIGGVPPETTSWRPS